MASYDEQRRLRLRRLDDCLNVLEREHEMNRTRVTLKLATLLQERVPSVQKDMLIVDAIDEVLREQQPLMIETAGDPPRSSTRSRRSYLPKDKREDYSRLAS